MRAFQRLLQSTFIALAVLLTGCGGGSGGGSVASGGIGGTGQIASGTITAFGSIFVNGIEFKNIGTATCTIDGASVPGSNCQSSLQLGMVVKVNGTFDSTTGTGTTTQVVYNDDVDGPVSNILPTTANLGPADVTRTFTVLNTKVQIDSASTKFTSTTGTKGFRTLTDTDVVEVSGFFDSNGLLHATYIEVKPTFTNNTTKVEIKGSVSMTNPAGGASAAGDSFDVTGTNNIPINVVIASSSQVPGGADLSDMPGGVVQKNTLVEVRGTYDSATKTITADRVQPDDTSIGGDGDEVNIEGLVTDFVSQGNFKVAGQQVDATSAIFSPLTLMSQLANGIKVEVEGHISGTTLNATKVESRGNDIKIEAKVLSKDPAANTVTVQFASGDALVVQVDNQTQMEDKTNAVQNLKVSNFNAGDFLEIRGFINTDTMIDVTASQIRRTTPDDDVLEGPLDSASGVSNSVSILGVNFTTDPVNTDFSGSGVSDSATFYNKAQGGCIVKVEDGDVPTTNPNGVADEISLEGSCP